MPRYFFSVFDDRQYIKDHHGVELLDVTQAKLELVRLAKLLPENLRRGGVRIALHDERGGLLAEEWVIPPV